MTHLYDIRGADLNALLAQHPLPPDVERRDDLIHLLAPDGSLIGVADGEYLLYSHKLSLGVPADRQEARGLLQKIRRGLGLDLPERHLPRIWEAWGLSEEDYGVVLQMLAEMNDRHG